MLDDKEVYELSLGYPLKQYTPWYSHLLAVASIDNNFQEWMYCNNINVVLRRVNTDKYYKGVAICFEDIPECIELKSIPYIPLRLCVGNICAFIEDALKLGYYVLIDVDPYYLSCFGKFYMRRHSHNTITVYGYCNKGFKIAIFDDCPNYHYQKCISPYSEMKKSLYEDTIIKKIPFWLEKFNLVHYRKETLRFSADKLKAELLTYNNGNYDDSDAGIVARGGEIFDELGNSDVEMQKSYACVMDSLLEYHRIMAERYDYIIKTKLTAEDNSTREIIQDNIAICNRLKDNVFGEYVKKEFKKIKENIKIIYNSILFGLK